MRQVRITRAGKPEVLQLSEGPDPTPGPGEVRVQVAAIGVNFADIMGRMGLYPDAPRIPYVPGYEVAGTIDAVGAGGDSALIGRDVFALTRFGGYASAVCIPAEVAIPRPESMSVETAAGFPLAFLTAYMALVVMGGIQSGDRVLIHAAAGGVGLAAVNIARLFEATIYGTASAAKHDFLRERGVQHPIDYRHENVEHAIRRLTGGRGVQIAMDPIGGRSWARSYRSLAVGGTLVISGVFALAPGRSRSLGALLKFVLGTPWLLLNPLRLTSDNRAVAGINLGHLWDEGALVREWIDELLTWWSAGKLDVHVDRTFPLEAAADAHAYIQARRNVGKVILIP